MKQNLLYIVTKLELGGAQKHVLDLIRHADRDHFNVFLFTARDGFLCSDALLIPDLTVHSSRFLDRPFHPIKDILAFCEIYLFIRKNKISLVHTHSSKAGILGRWAAWLAKVESIVHTVHGWSFHEYQFPPLWFFFLILERWTAEITDKIIVVSSWDKRQGLRRRIGKEQKYALAPYGIEMEIFLGKEETGSLRNELGLSEDDLLVGSISCLKRQKAPQDFIKLAFLVKQSFPRVKFLLAGDGALKKEAVSLVRRLGLDEDVLFLGWRRDIPRFLKSLDVFVLTSLWEGLPISILEAMASARAVVATDTGGIRDVARDGKTAYLSDVHDLENMRTKLSSLLTDASRRQRLGLAGQESLGDDFCLNVMLERNFALYDELLHQKDNSHGN